MVLVVGIALIWAAFRVKSYQKSILNSLGIAVVLLLSRQVTALFTGLVSGEANASSGWRLFVVAGIVIFSIVVRFLGIGGVFLLREHYESR
jgi:hypothetical protein